MQAMTTTKHTPTPWTIDPEHPLEIRGVQYQSTTRVATVNAPYLSEQQYPNAARIVQCVNACEGIEDPAALVKALKFCVQAIRTAGIESVPGGICAQAYDEALRALGG